MAYDMTMVILLLGLSFLTTLELTILLFHFFYRYLVCLMSYSLNQLHVNLRHTANTSHDLLIEPVKNTANS